MLTRVLAKWWEVDTHRISSRYGRAETYGERRQQSVAWKRHLAGRTGVFSSKHKYVCRIFN